VRLLHHSSEGGNVFAAAMGPPDRIQANDGHVYAIAKPPRKSRLSRTGAAQNDDPGHHDWLPQDFPLRQGAFFNASQLF
jgi:hypothetical protein